MGYDTQFDGRFWLDKRLSSQHATYLKKFSETRRMTRDPKLAEKMPDPVREAVGLPIGEDAAFFVGGLGSFGQGKDPSIVDNNQQPSGQPGLWCKWVPSEDLASIEWNGVEKFYNYQDWLIYIRNNFLRPWGYELSSGEVSWQGDESDDFGVIRVVDGAIFVKEGVRSLGEAKRIG